MSEFTESYKSLKGSILRTVVYTIGHFFIAAACVMFFTGAPFFVAITNAIVEPILNGVWFFVLDYLWTKSSNNHTST